MKILFVKIIRVHFDGEEWKEKYGQAIMCIECMIFFISDQVNQGNVNVRYSPTSEMIGDL